MKYSDPDAYKRDVEAAEKIRRAALRQVVATYSQAKGDAEKQHYERLVAIHNTYCVDPECEVCK